MALSSPTLKTANHALSSTTSATTAAVSFVAGQLYVVAVHVNATSVADPTLAASSNGSFTKIRSQLWDLNRRIIGLWYAVATVTTSEVITITNSPSAVTGWAVIEVASGFASSPIGVSNSAFDDGSVNTISVDVGTLQDTSSIVIAAAAVKDDVATTPGTGWTELSDDVLATNWSMETEWKLNDDTPSASWGISNSAAIVGAEVKVPAAVGARMMTLLGVGS
jgi:hypothetical protein